MVVALNTLINRSVRNMGSNINSVVKESAIEVIKLAYKEKIYVQITSGYRSFADQTKLYNQGRTNRSKPIVTNAKAGQSTHNYGLAIDFVLVSDDGNRTIWVINAKWRRVIAIAKSLGFSSGADWTSFKDYPHLDMMGGLSLRDLQNGKRPKLSMAKTTAKPAATPAPKAEVKAAPSPKKKPSKLVYNGLLKSKSSGNSVKALQTALAYLGYAVGAIDGKFGDKCTKAVKAFQKKYKLTQDGIVGKSTINKINSLI